MPHHGASDRSMAVWLSVRTPDGHYSGTTDTHSGTSHAALPESTDLVGLLSVSCPRRSSVQKRSRLGNAFALSVSISHYIE
jgi:hypothetical protein